MTRPSKQRVTTAIRFPPHVHEALKETADEVGVGINWLVNQAVISYLERLELPLRLTKDPTS